MALFVASVFFHRHTVVVFLRKEMAAWTGLQLAKKAYCSTPSHFNAVLALLRNKLHFVWVTARLPTLQAPTGPRVYSCPLVQAAGGSDARKTERGRVLMRALKFSGWILSGACQEKLETVCSF